MIDIYDIRPVPPCTCGSAQAQHRDRSPYLIERNVPIPRKLSARHDSPVHSLPFRHMRVGDSFFVPLGDGFGNDIEELSKAISTRANRHLGRGNYACRIAPQRDGVRIWRRAPRGCL